MSYTTELRARGHRHLIAWQKAMDLADRVLAVCETVPARAGAGLIPQLRRAIISIPSNIAEGHGRPRAEYANFLRIARGSLREAETQLELLLRRGAAKTETLIALLKDADELGRIIHGLLKHLASAE